MKRLGLFCVLVLAACIATPTVPPSVAPSTPSATAPAGETETRVPSATAAPARTKLSPTQRATQQSTPVDTSSFIAPYPDAPLCPDTGPAHDNSRFHTLWDSTRGCHYDHEHGVSPFTPEVAATFPGFDLPALLGGVGVGHTNPSSPKENTSKHGGFKWQVDLAHPHGCEGHEGSPIGVNASVIQYHAFGNYAIELEARIHSVLALLRQCTVDNPTDYGYMYVVQHVDYGQRVSPYQGTVLPYPDSHKPAYAPGRAPYFTIDCIGGAPCNSKFGSRQAILDHNANAATTWTSDPGQLSDSGSHLFELLFRGRDNYQVLDLSDESYPFTFVWLCSNDGGLSYSPMRGCRYNNSTTMIHEIKGTIPAEWDNLAGFDTDARVGRITADSFVTKFGDLKQNCNRANPECFPIKLVHAYVGHYGSFLLSSKNAQFTAEGLPERDIYFCGAQACSEGDPGAVASGWIGPNN